MASSCRIPARSQPSAASHRAVYAALVRHNGRPFVPSRLDPREPLVGDGLVAIRQMMRLAHSHGLDLVDTHLGPSSSATIRGPPAGLCGYDTIVSAYLSGRFSTTRGPLAWPCGGPDQPDPAGYATAAQYRQATADC